MLVSGMATTPGVDHVYDVIANGAFAASIAKRGLQGPQAVKFLWGHDSDKPIGAITKLEQRNVGLWMEADINESISWAKDYAIAAEAAGGFSFSVGFRIHDADLIEHPSGYVGLYIMEGDLTEVSAVVFPCNDEAAMLDLGDKSKVLPPQMQSATAKLKELQRVLDRA